MKTMPTRFARLGSVALVFACVAGQALAQNVIYSCEMEDGSVVLETEQVSKKCQKVSETVAPPAPAAAPATAAASAPKAPAAKPVAATPAAPSGKSVATVSGDLVVKAKPAPVRVPPKRTASETYRDVQVKQAENALHTDDPEHGIVGAAPTSNSSRRYLMIDRAHYQKAYGGPTAAPAPAQEQR